MERTAAKPGRAPRPFVELTPASQSHRRKMWYLHPEDYKEEMRAMASMLAKNPRSLHQKTMHVILEVWEKNGWTLPEDVHAAMDNQSKELAEFGEWLARVDSNINQASTEFKWECLARQARTVVDTKVTEHESLRTKYKALEAERKKDIAALKDQARADLAQMWEESARRVKRKVSELENKLEELEEQNKKLKQVTLTQHFMLSVLSKSVPVVAPVDTPTVLPLVATPTKPTPTKPTPPPAPKADP